MNAEDVPEQVTIAALATYMGRPQRVLLSEDCGKPYEQMGDALAVALAHPDAQTAQAETARSEGFTAGQRHEMDKVQVGSARVTRGLGELLASAPGDLRVDPDVRVDAAYQRGFGAGRATVASVPVEATLGQVVDEETRAATLATLAAQKRHAEVAAEGILEQSELGRSAEQILRDDVAYRRQLDADRLPPSYVVRRDAIFAALQHSEMRTRYDSDPYITTREMIMREVEGFWLRQFAPSVGDDADD